MLLSKATYNWESTYNPKRLTIDFVLYTVLYINIFATMFLIEFFLKIASFPG